MRVDEFDFYLPDALIAQHPPEVRGTSRLMVLERTTGRTAVGVVSDVTRWLRRGDVLVLNDTRVFPARLLGRRLPGGGRLECLLVDRLSNGATSQDSDAGLGDGLRAQGSGLGEGLRARRSGPREHAEGTVAISEHANGRTPQVSDAGLGGLEAQGSGLGEELRAPGSGPSEHAEGTVAIWEALVHPGQRLRVGSRFVCEGPEPASPDGPVTRIVIHGEIIGRGSHGKRTVRLRAEGVADVDAAIDAIGHIPLPPYIRRPDASADQDRYQTVYARERGSVAAPTAGLHLTPALLDQLRAMGVEVVTVTLHVGYGTFKPVRVDDIEDHVVDAERYEVSEDTAATINRAKTEGRRVVVVGTTSTRALESAADEHGRVRAGAATTSLYIRPGHRFRVVDALMTNFHVPRSSLLFLVSAFAGREQVLAAYARAVDEGFRFYSYGDAMLIV